MIKLRPHHLLCMQSFQGKGYSDEFIDKMTEVTNTLRANPDTQIQIIFSDDCLCNACPNLNTDRRCTSQSFVQQLDLSVIQLLNLQEDFYNYRDLIQEMEHKLTPALFFSICNQCQWFSICKEF